MTADPFEAKISRHIWDTKYRFRLRGAISDHGVEETWQRVAHALASVDTADRDAWEARFLDALRDFIFLPGGRILAGAGTPHRVTLFNCFVMGLIEDSIDGIFAGLKEAAVTMQEGGGIGCDFSTIRPGGTHVQSAGGIASGPVSFMRVWDSMCATLLSTGVRRGAMMATLRCDHPDIVEFIDAKRDARSLRHFNLSVQVTDAFIKAVHRDEDWELVFPAERIESDATQHIERAWTGHTEPVPCVVLRTMRARELWHKMVRAAYDSAEPGMLFIDRINGANNLWYREQLTTTNPCGEVPLPPHGACNLGSVNLTHFVRQSFKPDARFDFDGLADVTHTAVRMLDNVIDLSRFPLEQQAEQAHSTRRIGIGITGLADTLILLGLHYAESEARETASTIMRTICHAAYRTSIELAKEKGSFPFFERDQYVSGRFIQSLPGDIIDAISQYGIRNSHLTAIAPTGTISLLANNISSGIEPVFSFQHGRRILQPDGRYAEYVLTDYAYRLWQRRGGSPTDLPSFFIDAQSLEPQAHLDMQAALQPYVDSAISKTINVPERYEPDEFSRIYDQAYEHGLKGCTTFRSNPITGAILQPGESGREEGIYAPHCCSIEREAD